MTVKPSEITRRGCLWKLAAGFDQWVDGARLLTDILDYLHDNHSGQLTTAILKDFFIEKANSYGIRNVEQELQNFQEQGYVEIKGNLIFFKEKFLSCWQKTYDYQENRENFRGGWGCHR